MIASVTVSVSISFLSLPLPTTLTQQIYGFGENNLYSMYDQSDWHKRLSDFTRKSFGFSMPNFMGRGILQENVGPLPDGVPVHIVIGDPIECVKTLNPTEEEIENVGAILLLAEEGELTRYC